MTERRKGEEQTKILGRLYVNWVDLHLWCSFNQGIMSLIDLSSFPSPSGKCLHEKHQFTLPFKTASVYTMIRLTWGISQPSSNLAGLALLCFCTGSKTLLLRRSWELCFLLEDCIPRSIFWDLLQFLLCLKTLFSQPFTSVPLDGYKNSTGFNLDLSLSFGTS